MKGSRVTAGNRLEINLTSSSDQVKLFYISQCYDRPVPQFMPKCHRVHIEHEGQCEQGNIENAGYDLIQRLTS